MARHTEKKTRTYWALTGVTRVPTIVPGGDQTTRRPMFCSEREELSLSLNKVRNNWSKGADETSCGKPFHVCEPKTRKDQL